MSCFFETFPAGWVGGWVVGKSDFNENPVVSPDLDLDFGLRLRVCQNQDDKIQAGARAELGKNRINIYELIIDKP